MCTFLSTLSKKSKVKGNTKKKNFVLTLRECPEENGEKTWYIVRLLNFQSKTSTRDYAFIERYVHQIWGINEAGKRVVKDEVVCPVTKYVDWEGNRYDCPICKYASQQYGVYKESNYKDTDAGKKNREFSRKFQGIVPVYVVKDPNYPGNEGRCKVIVFNDKKQYEEFEKKVQKQLLKCNCFNGGKAVDCCIHVSRVEKVNNEGTPKEYRWTQKEIDTIAFLKPEKAYEIPKITRQYIDEFPFDDEYYVSPTQDDLKAFYDEHIKVNVTSTDIDISDDDQEIKLDEEVKEDKPTQKSNVVEDTVRENTEAKKSDSSEDIDSLDIDSLVSGSDDPVSGAAASKAEEDSTDGMSDLDLDKLIADI